jgi:twitching motility protein PilT
MDLTELLAFVVKNKASDLHLSSGLPPMIRVHGDVRRINVPAMEHKDVHGMIYDIMNDGQRKFYEENLECDFSFAVPNLAPSASTPSCSSAAPPRSCGPFPRRSFRSRT